MFILVIGVLIIFCILLFICYSYMQNQRSKYVTQMYKEFKEQYGSCAQTAMGFSQTNVFSKAITLMLAVNPEDHRCMGSDRQRYGDRRKNLYRISWDGYQQICKRR